MMIEINKDIEHYKESIVLGLTARQLFFSLASVVTGGGLVLLLYPYIGLTGAAYVAVPAVVPIALGGFYSYQGMNFYEYMGRKLYFLFGNRTLTYVSTESETELKKFQAEDNQQKKPERKTPKKRTPEKRTPEIRTLSYLGKYAPTKAGQKAEKKTDKEEIQNGMDT